MLNYLQHEHLKKKTHLCRIILGKLFKKTEQSLNNLFWPVSAGESFFSVQQFVCFETDKGNMKELLMWVKLWTWKALLDPEKQKHKVEKSPDPEVDFSEFKFLDLHFLGLPWAYSLDSLGHSLPMCTIAIMIPNSQMK